MEGRAQSGAPEATEERKGMSNIMKHRILAAAAFAAAASLTNVYAQTTMPQQPVQPSTEVSPSTPPTHPAVEPSTQPSNLPSGAAVPTGTQAIPESTGATSAMPDRSIDSAPVPVPNRRESAAALAEAKQACRAEGSGDARSQCMKRAQEEYKRSLDSNHDGRIDGSSDSSRSGTPRY
jgi:hypothetical protein